MRARNAGWVAAGFVLLLVASSLALYNGSGSALRPLPVKGSERQSPPAVPVPSAPRSTATPWAEAGIPKVDASALVLPHYPAAWGPHHIPPGIPVPSHSRAALSVGRSSSWGAPYPYVDGTCFGRWSAGGQWAYANGCYGHDEPGLEPFSNLPGSGGNVTWNVTLPVDRSPSQNQSDLYTAVWFGMNLADPYGYDGQCFLELQLYPDTNGNFTQQAGVWSAFAVAWQIELANGFEDPCFAGTLHVRHSSAPIVFNQGDHLVITMLGWLGSPYGENITVYDVSTGQSGFMNLFNRALGYPLDPAYPTNNIDGALPWSPGGDLPVSFAFEGGHTYVGPSNSSFGGCTAGVPPPNPFNPSTPCPTYDPQSWANDTLVPWHFYPTTFFNARTRAVSSQTGFIQDFGGPAWIDPLSLGTCTGRDGSAWCSYPWFSYLGAIHAYTFGATDYLGTTADFGKYDQYATQLTAESAELGYFAVNNFTGPTTGGAALTISVHGSGSVRFLNYSVSGNRTFSNVPLGSYSVNGIAANGAYFRTYRGSGGVHVDAATTAWSSFGFTGGGVLNVTFAAKPAAAVHLTVNGLGPHGSVGIDPGFIVPITANYPALPGVGSGFAVQVPSLTVTNGTAFGLTPGIYAFQAYPKPGYNFTGWAATAGIYLFTPATNYTWVNVTTGGTVDAHFARTTERATVYFYTAPAEAGTITFGGHGYSNGANTSLAAGTYAASANANTSWRFVAWETLWSGGMVNFSRSTIVQLQNGSTPLVAVFAANPTVNVTVVGSGTVALNDAPVAGSVALPEAGVNAAYPLWAYPARGYAFAGWTVAAGGPLALKNNGSAVTTLTVSGSGNLTAVFRALHVTATVTFTPGAGTIVLDDVRAIAKATNLGGLPHGTWAISALAPPGMSFAGWSFTGGANVSTRYSLDLAGEWVAESLLRLTGNGTVSASFATQAFPVTFVDPASPSGGIATFVGAAGRFTAPSGTTVGLPIGPYAVLLSGGVVHSVLWTATSNLTVTNASARTASVWVFGSGSLYGIAVSDPVLHSFTASPRTSVVGATIDIVAVIFGGTGPFTYSLTPAPGVPAHTFSCGTTPLLTALNRSEFDCVAHRLGTFTLDLTVTDAFGHTVFGSATVRVR
ncbi:MAG TPA: hypothetical protein VFF67_04615 [Thermoplasmata archaeon]|nr:hypothetical protein [Thermoplasmata archaeon]